MSLRGHPYADFLADIEKPQRYIGGEYGSVVKQAKDLTARMVLIFPDVYEVGMSHLGTSFLYHYINKEPDLAMERCFAAWPDMESQLKKRNLPLISLESRSPIKSFDCVGFSLQYELTYPTILASLDLSDIPIRASERSQTDPIIIGGGPLATYPEPMAPFFDAFFIGEAEAGFNDVLRTIGRMRRAGASRMEIIRKIAEKPGVYCPALYNLERDELTGVMYPVPAVSGVPERVKRVYVPDLVQAPLPQKQVMAWDQAIFDRVTVELARGCSEGCRFCHAGFAYRPTRDRRPSEVLQTVHAMVENMGYDEVSLSSLSPADYPGIDRLITLIADQPDMTDISLSVSSLRAYGLSDDTLSTIKRVRATGLTLAPEAGSQRLRDVINKNITETQILESVDRVFAHGWSKLKLYFMLGLPTETMEDCLAIRSLADKAFVTARKHMRRPRVIVSVSTFVPKPHTPFQWEGFIGLDEVRRRQSCLKDAFRGSAIELRLHDPMMSVIEAALCRGDRRVADVVEQAYRRGARMDSWGDQFDPGLWLQAFDAVGIPVGSNAFPLQGHLPWDHIDVGVKTGFLRREYERGLAAKTSPPCEKPAKWQRDDDFMNKKALICHDCGLPCDTKAILEERRRNIVAVRSMDEVRKPETVENGEAVRVHMVFTKLDTAAFLSGLDLMRHIPRLLRRAGVRMRYTTGFHPRAKLSARSPLGLGFQSLGEWMDAWVYGRIPTADELNRMGLYGIRFLMVQQVPPNTKPHPSNRDEYLFLCKDLPQKYHSESMGYAIEELDGPFAGQRAFLIRRSPWKGDRPALEKWVSALAERPISRYKFIRLYDSPYGNRFKIGLKDVEDIFIAYTVRGWDN